MEKEKKVLSLKPKSATTEDEALTLKRPSKKRIIRREDIPAEKLANARPIKRSPPPPPKRPVKKLTPAEQQAMDLTEQLALQFKTWQECKPLVLGIEQVLQQHFIAQGITVSKRVLHRVLWHHTHQKEYLQQILIDSQRYELDGTPAGEIRESEQEHAQRTLDEIAIMTAPKPLARNGRPALRSPRPR